MRVRQYHELPVITHLIQELLIRDLQAVIASDLSGGRFRRI